MSLAAEADAIQARMVTLASRLQSSGVVEAATEVPLELWLAIQARMTAGDRRTLQAVADLAPALPATTVAFCDGRLSWSQYRTIVTTVGRARPHRDTLAELDRAIADETDRLSDAEPDALVWLVDHHLATHQPDQLERDEQAALDTSWLALQPRLDGTGARIAGELDAVGTAIVDQALSARMDRPAAGDPAASDTVGADPVTTGTRARRRAAALVDLCAASLADTDGTPTRPLLLLTCSLEALLGVTHEPGALITRLTGGRLKVTAATARRLVDHHGAAVRTIVLDDTGTTLGVGRRTAVPPGWLSDTLLALHATCTAPGCRMPARLCDLDHAHETARDHGATDLHNLHPTCRPHHRAKTARHWHVTISPDHTVTWEHTRTRLRTDTITTTRRLRL